MRRLDHIEVHTANFNRWTFRRVGGEWKIAERVVRAIGTAEAEDVIVQTGQPAPKETSP